MEKIKYITKVILVQVVSGLLFLSNISFADNRSQNVSETDEYEQQERRVGERSFRVPVNTEMALNEPDLYAWKLFVAINWPVDAGTCRPDASKAIGDEGATVWESWPSREEIFLPGAEKPKSWRKNCSGSRDESLPEGDFSTLADETVRVNRKSFKYIRANKLYSLDEQERLVRAGVRDVEFPLGSRSIKAHWVVISEFDKERYHWVETISDDATVIYGLSALHISSKDNPTWFWSTFEHVDNESVWPLIYPEAFRGWVVPSVDNVSCLSNNLGCNKIPEGFGLEGTKWENYRLRGTQVDWVDNRGNPTILTNSQIEGFLDQRTMSCLTCHALGVKGESGDSMPIPVVPGTLNNEGFPHGYVGAPAPELFHDENGVPIPYLGLDYVWTLRNAHREE